MKKKSEIDRWKAIHKPGGIYCSPACGGGCTATDYILAGERAAILCKYLGPGWTPHVWENLGWHYCAHSPCGRIKVHPSEKTKPRGKACAFLGDKDFCGGTWAQHGDSPKHAVAQVVVAGKQALAKIGAQLNGL